MEFTLRWFPLRESFFSGLLRTSKMILSKSQESPSTANCWPSRKPAKALLQVCSRPQQLFDPDKQDVPKGETKKTNTTQHPENRAGPLSVIRKGSFDSYLEVGVREREVLLFVRFRGPFLSLKETPGSILTWLWVKTTAILG